MVAHRLIVEYLQVEQIKTYFEEQVGSDLPKPIAEQLHQLRDRVGSM